MGKWIGWTGLSLICVMTSGCNERGVLIAPNEPPAPSPNVLIAPPIFTPDQVITEALRKPKPIATATPSAAPSPAPTEVTPTALIFNGAGTSLSDFDSLKSIALARGLSYQEVSSATLEAMTLDQLSKFKLIIWPGGDSNIMTAGLTRIARERIREAVVNRGVNFVGFCAGAWMAVGPAVQTGSAPYWGLSIVTGDYLKQYFPNGQSPTAAMIWTRFADSSARDLVWWGGPYLPNDAGTTIARYPDGSSAIMQTQAGNGFVILSGLHPEAPQSWRDAAGLTDSDGLDHALAWTLIQSALTRARLAVY